MPLRPAHRRRTATHAHLLSCSTSAGTRRDRPPPTASTKPPRRPHRTRPRPRGTSSPSASTSPRPPCTAQPCPTPSWTAQSTAAERAIGSLAVRHTLPSGGTRGSTRRRPSRRSRSCRRTSGAPAARAPPSTPPSAEAKSLRRMPRTLGGSFLNLQSATLGSAPDHCFVIDGDFRDSASGIRPAGGERNQQMNRGGWPYTPPAPPHTQARGQFYLEGEDADVAGVGGVHLLPVACPVVSSRSSIPNFFHGRGCLGGLRRRLRAPLPRP